MMQNHYIKRCIKKDGIAGFSGCLEHTTTISQLIQEVKQEKGALSVIQLDLANAYRLIPHDLMQEGLNHNYIPVAIRDNRQLSRRVETLLHISTFHNQLAGSPEGDSNREYHFPILFIMGMNLLISTAGVTHSPVLELDIVKPALQGFMEITITTVSHVQVRLLLETLNNVAIWEKISF